jgi:ribosomal protein S20
MNLAEKEKMANHLRSQIKDKKKEFKNTLLNMKGGGEVQTFWKKKHQENINNKQKALEHMNSILKYLEKSGGGLEKVKMEKDKINTSIRELEQQIEDESF